MADSSADGAATRELVFMCADTGAVVALTWRQAKRPVLIRAVIFLTSGDTLWIDGAPDSDSRVTLAVRDRGSADQYDLRLAARAALLTWPAEVGELGWGGQPAVGPRVPAGLELAFDPASPQLTLGPGAPAAGRVTLVRGTGSLAAGSVIHRVEGTGWSAAGRGGAPGAAAECRARAVFQDGSALYVADSSGEADGTGTAAGPIAAFVHNTRIRAAAVRDFTVRGAERGRPGRAVSWAADGRSPAGAAAQIRDMAQQLTLTRRDPAGSGWLSWSCSPFVFVRSGVTGLGLVERRARLPDPVPQAEAADELPDPF